MCWKRGVLGLVYHLVIIKKLGLAGKALSFVMFGDIEALVDRMLVWQKGGKDVFIK
jgi:hypothetical protein